MREQKVSAALSFLPSFRVPEPHGSCTALPNMLKKSRLVNTVVHVQLQQDPRWLQHLKGHLKIEILIRVSWGKICQWQGSCPGVMGRTQGCLRYCIFENQLPLSSHVLFQMSYASCSKQTRDGHSAGVQKYLSNTELWQIVTGGNTEA